MLVLVFVGPAQDADLHRGEPLVGQELQDLMLGVALVEPDPPYPVAVPPAY